MFNADKLATFRFYSYTSSYSTLNLFLSSSSAVYNFTVLIYPSLSAAYSATFLYIPAFVSLAFFSFSLKILVLAVIILRGMIEAKAKAGELYITKATPPTKNTPPLIPVLISNVIV